MKPWMRHGLLAVLGICVPAVQAADLLVKNVNGHTLDAGGHLRRFDALLVDRGKVVATGHGTALAARTC